MHKDFSECILCNICVRKNPQANGVCRVNALNNAQPVSALLEMEKNASTRKLIKSCYDKYSLIIKTLTNGIPGKISIGQKQLTRYPITGIQCNPLLCNLQNLGNEHLFYVCSVCCCNKKTNNRQCMSELIN